MSTKTSTMSSTKTTSTLTEPSKTSTTSLNEFSTSKTKTTQLSSQTSNTTFSTPSKSSITKSPTSSSQKTTSISTPSTSTKTPTPPTISTEKTTETFDSRKKREKRKNEKKKSEDNYPSSWELKQVASSFSLDEIIYPEEFKQDQSQVRWDALLHDPDNYSDPQSYSYTDPVNQKQIRRPKHIRVNNETIDLEDLPSNFSQNSVDFLDSSEELRYEQGKIWDPIRYLLDMKESNLYHPAFPDDDIDVVYTAWKSNIREYYRYAGKDEEDHWPKWREIILSYDFWVYSYFFGYLEVIYDFVSELPYYILRGIFRPFSMLINFQPPKSLFDDYEIQEAMHSHEARKYLYQIVVQDIQKNKKLKEKENETIPDNEVRETEDQVRKLLENAPILSEVLKPRAIPQTEPLFSGWGSTLFWKKFNWAWEADFDDDYYIGKTSIQYDGHNQITYIDATNETMYHSSLIPLEYFIIHPVYNTPFVQWVQFLKHQLIVPFGTGLFLGASFSFLEYLQMSFDRIQASDVLGGLASENLNYHVDNFSPLPGKLQSPNHAYLTREIFKNGSQMREMLRGKERNDLWMRLPTKYTDAGYTPAYDSPYDDNIFDKENLNYGEPMYNTAALNHHLWRVEDWSWAHPQREENLSKYSNPSYVADVDAYEWKYRRDHLEDAPRIAQDPVSPLDFLSNATDSALKGLTYFTRSYFDPSSRIK